MLKEYDPSFERKTNDCLVTLEVKGGQGEDSHLLLPDLSCHYKKWMSVLMIKKKIF